VLIAAVLAVAITFSVPVSADDSSLYVELSNGIPSGGVQYTFSDGTYISVGTDGAVVGKSFKLWSDTDHEHNFKYPRKSLVHQYVYDKKGNVIGEVYENELVDVRSLTDKYLETTEWGELRCVKIEYYSNVSHKWKTGYVDRGNLALSITDAYIDIRD
jgi:hypothetical protein